MTAEWSPQSLGVFSLVLVATFVVAWKGNRDAPSDSENNIHKQGLNRWLLALSAGAAANSGFVVTGAVGLGYMYGMTWVLLPLSWLVGDLVFWHFFPHKITSYGHKSGSTTLRDIVSHQLPIGRYHPLAIATTAIVVVCLGGYTMAQWVAGQKFLDGAFGLSQTYTLIIFAAFIVAYSSIGQFRGSVYADTFQAITRVMGTIIALSTVAWHAITNSGAFSDNIRSVGPDFLNLFGESTFLGSLGFIVGYASAAIGFGLGQPQVTSRYLAARDPQETKAAKWIYILYVQLTWATMTIFGVILRGVMPDISDPEKGLTVFVAAALPPALVGLIVADIFGAIASTANSLLVAMAQATRDALPRKNGTLVPLWPIVLVEGTVTMVLAAIFLKHTTVFSLAITSVSLMAAGLAPAVAIKVLGLKHNASSITTAVFAGFASALVWNAKGLSGLINESAVGIPVGFLVNYLLSFNNAAVVTSLNHKEHNKVL
jgi:Na+/proline symporter